MQGENNTQTKAIIENSSEKSEEIHGASPETPAEAETPTSASSDVPASSGFGGFLAVFSLVSTVYCFKRS